MSEFQDKLPPNWIASSLGEICSQPQYGYTTKGTGNGTLRLLRTTDITSGNICWESVPFCLENPTDEAKYLLEDGDIVISRAGSVGVSYLLKNPERSVFASYLIRFKPYINTQFFKYFLGSSYYWQEIADNKLGIAVPNVNASKLKEIAIPLPPHNEQLRIVAKIEELFSELDKGIENLKTAREQLKVYRQALLKHAFEGKLTAAWREENRDIVGARFIAPDSQIARVNQGAINRAPTKRRKILPPLTTEELVELPKLPNGWGWMKLGNTEAEISDGPFGSNLKTSDYVAGGVRVVRLENIGVLEFIENKETYITEEKYDLLKRHTVTAGDIIFSSFILENIRVAVIPPSITKAINKADCFCVRLSGETLCSSYAVMFLSSRHVYKQLEALVHGIGRPRINTTQLKSVAIPVCCIEEQKIIISELESRFSEVDHLDQTIATALQQSASLRQSILKKAFSGRLVPQDPHDEPASVLLERIRAEKRTTVKAGKSLRARPVGPKR